MRPLPMARRADLPVDPVCGMTVDPATAPARRESGGRTFLFCCAGCAARFDGDPEGWISGRAREAAAARAAAAPPGTAWICPMCPEVRESSPVPCPVCGMALEPAGPPRAGTGGGESPELRDMRRRFLLSLLFTAPLLLLSMGPMAGIPADRWLPDGAAPFAQLLLAAPVVLGCGWPFLERAARSLATRRLNMFTLIGLGTAAAFLLSAAAVLAPGLFPASARDHHGNLPLHFESAAVITTLVALGQALEMAARARTGSALRALMDLAPAVARRLRADGGEEEVPLDAVRAGDRLRVAAGGKVPVDGRILEGAAAVDESMVTGESLPADRGPGDAVTGGTLVADGGFVMEALRVGADTLLARIVALVAEAQRSRAPVQALADRVAAGFVPAVAAAALLSFAGWMALGPEPRLSHAVVAAVSVLVIACPCALGLATPMSLMVGMGRGAGAGVLFRNAAALEALERVEVLVVDKTGTLTAGRPEVVAVVAAGGDGESSREVVVRCAAAVERWSGHPLAGAVLREAARRGLRVPDAGAFRSMAGKGAAASVEGRAVAVGNRRLLGDMDLAPGELEAAAATEEEEGRTVLFTVAGGRVIGFLAVADRVKGTTPEALAALRADGVEVVMATGDSRAAAHSVAGELGIGRVEAEASPERKAALVAELRAAGRVVAMAGDGVNDGPALAGADVGIAMGDGTDVARESAGVTLVKGDLRAVVRARRLSRGVMGNIRQNLFLALAYNALCIPLAAGLLYPLTGTLLSPMIAAAAMSLSSLSVIGNALRLRGRRL